MEGLIAKRVEEFETGTQIDLVMVFEVDREHLGELEMSRDGDPRGNPLGG